MHSFFKRTKTSSTFKRAFSFMIMLTMIFSTMMPALSVSAAESDNGLDVVLMSLTRTAATAAEAGNQFGADSGVFAEVSNLTAWSNNTQKIVGGTGRTPIVFNNAQTTGGWKPISVAGLDHADAFQIMFSTVGYENIRFTCRQKSTGSGPDAFQLAYSIGNPDGPYTLIENSRTGSNGIPAITRMSNDTYAALRDSYDDFILPIETENQAEVYLRVVFDGLTNLGQNGNTSINDIVIIGDVATSVVVELDVSLMSLTRTTATVAEAGNQFGADSGVFAEISNLTAWSNNTQKIVGGTGRTPIVFNNAQTTGGWKPISVAGLDHADAFQIMFSTLGYENIRFTCRQKSTGSGPDAFQLAYSVGNPDGPYTLIENSRTGTNGIPAITRMSNDTYAALRDSYDNFVLPAEMENEAEVYLRVVFDGLTNLGANGNTSINDIVIIGDQRGGSGVVVVNKTALNALIVEASQKVESDYAPATWIPFAAALADAQTVSDDTTATQQEVNAARFRLQAAMNALVLLSDYVPLIAWPGPDTVTAWDTTRVFFPTGSRLDASGLDFFNGQLYGVNNKDGRFWILDVDRETGDLAFADGFDGNGRRVSFRTRTGTDPDIEGITVDGDGNVYFASERDNDRSNVNWNVILKIEKDAWITQPTGVIRATREWDITNSLPNVPANLGVEAVQWIPFSAVDGKLFDDNTNAPFNSANYPNAIANGVFFVGFEDNGHLYAFVLHDDETFVRIADINSRLGAVMALDYDAYEDVLWAKADNTQGNRSAIITFNGTRNVDIVHVNPPAGLNVRGNFEGFAIADASYTRNGLRPVFFFEDEPRERVLQIGYIYSDWTGNLCEICGEFDCEIEHVKCEVCDEFDCEIDHVKCEVCDEFDCEIDHVKCEVCGEFDCEIDHVKCEVCDEFDCETDHVKCEVCDEFDCETDHVKCEVCGEFDCETDHVKCEVCGEFDCETDHVKCEVCGEFDNCVCPTDAEFLQARAANILRNGLTERQLILSANNRATLTLVLDGREFVIATNVNNRNVSGQVELADGSGTLIFDIRGNGSNVREFRIVQK